jgi:hypothetical protein
MDVAAILYELERAWEAGSLPATSVCDGPESRWAGRNNASWGFLA